ncbi:HNH endonuclease signature motif containing protein [Sphingopyxis flava]|uniref:5-methylcytosine-specific restriction enzyme A n=1 Tax=Sphingopyxis flava TaxID=1507287 RepID=A0A1T4ZW81_9SPHN|nr:HNH endonuclease signature motif containing protein [Sphingopyxis flava]SKB27041.1 5-methylcytosine-specific restriction enzyme A [Sphingopyxis flava]
MGERIRGRKGQQLRRRRLANEPLCRRCKERGRITAATVPDHIKPLALGGEDVDENIRCLCDDCHDQVTREQFGHRRRTEVGADGWPVA